MTCVRVRACINVRLPLLYTTVQCADGGTSKITGITFADWGDPTAVGGSGPYDPHACEFKLNLQPIIIAPRPCIQRRQSRRYVSARASASSKQRA